jgi:DNA polymerase III sliding clamp (beta) subunit (PCNA family)
MKFKADARELRGLISELSSIAKPNPKDDVPTGVALKLEGPLLTMRICDLQGTFYSIRELQVDMEEEGEVVVDLAHFNKILSVQQRSIELDFTESKNGTLKQGKTRLTITVLPHSIHELDQPIVDDWYYLDEALPFTKAVVKANRNRDPEDDPRYAIGGIALLSNNGVLEVVGSNENSISVARTNLNFTHTKDLVVARAELATVLNTYEKDRNLNIALTEEGIWLRQNERLDLIGTVDELYPDYREIVSANGTPCGYLDVNTIKNIKTILQKDIIETNDFGHIWIKAGENNIQIGIDKHHTQSVEYSELKLPPICITGDSLTSILNMFDSDVTVEINKEDNHLYFNGKDQFALLLIEDMKDEQTI